MCIFAERLLFFSRVGVTGSCLSQLRISVTGILSSRILVQPPRCLAVIKDETCFPVSCNSFTLLLFYRERHDERLGGNFLRENRHFSQIPNGHPWHPSAIRREDTHKGKGELFPTLGLLGRSSCMCCSRPVSSTAAEATGGGLLQPVTASCSAGQIQVHVLPLLQTRLQSQGSVFTQVTISNISFCFNTITLVSITCYSTEPLKPLVMEQP